IQNKQQKTFTFHNACMHICVYKEEKKKTRPSPVYKLNPKKETYDAKYLRTASFSSTGNMLRTCCTPFRPPSLLPISNDATSVTTDWVLRLSILVWISFL